MIAEVARLQRCELGPKTLRGLQAVLEKYGPARRPVDVRRDDAIPRRECQAEIRSARMQCREQQAADSAWVETRRGERLRDIEFPIKTVNATNTQP